MSLAETHASLAYYFDHRAEIESELIAEYRELEEWKKVHPTPPLLVRLKEQRLTPNSGRTGLNNFRCD